jgi:hypothetical protein
MSLFEKVRHFATPFFSLLAHHALPVFQPAFRDLSIAAVSCRKNYMYLGFEYISKTA